MKPLTHLIKAEAQAIIVFFTKYIAKRRII